MLSESKTMMTALMQHVAEKNPQVLDSVIKSVTPDVADKFRAFIA